MSHTALLLIDVQQSFRHRPYWNGAEAETFLERCNTLIAGCQAGGIPIVRVFHTDGPDEAANPFSHASGHIRPLDGLRPFDAAQVVEKHRHSALVGTGLSIDCEATMDPALVQGLRDRGHQIEAYQDSYMDFGAGQFIWRLTDDLEDGYVAASDSRRDGHAACF